MGPDFVLQVVIGTATVALAVYTALMWRATRLAAESTKIVADRTNTLAEKTALLAEETRALAAETVRANDLADQHHQEMLTPCLVFRGTVNSPGNVELQALGELGNVGTGIALRPRVWIGELGEPILLGPISPNSVVQIDCRVTFIGTLRNPQPIKLVLLYDNLFGAEATTEHHGLCHQPNSFNTVFRPPMIVKRTTQSNRQ